MRLVVRWAMGLVALAAAALSYQSLMALAELAGYGRLSVLYPLVVDAGAAASCAAWLHTRGRQPLVMTWALLAVSVVLNGTTHYLESTHTAPSWLLVVAVAAVPPTVLGLCVHLAVGMGSTLVTLVTRVPESATSVKTFTDVGSASCPDAVPSVKTFAHGKPVKTFTPLAADDGVVDSFRTDDLKLSPLPSLDGNGCPDEGHTPEESFPQGHNLRTNDLRLSPLLTSGSNGEIESRAAIGTPDLTTTEGSLDEKYPQVRGGSIARSDEALQSVNPMESFPQDSRYVAELISRGAGRRKIAKELDISEHRARQLIAASRNGDGHVQA